MNDGEEHVMSTGERLVYMANQIARNLDLTGGDQASEMVADHIRSFWDPAMRARIIAIAREHPDALTPIAAAAVQRIGTA